MKSKRPKTRHDITTSEPVKILIQRVEFNEQGDPVLAYDSIRIEQPHKTVIRKGVHHE